VNTQERDNLRDLAELIAFDLGVPVEKMFQGYARGNVSKACHILALAASDAGFPHLAVSHFLQKDASYVTQIRRRKYALRETTSYFFARKFITERLERQNANP
jgi:hypothetical protein